MPFYYDVIRQASSNGSGSTESTHLRFLTVANQQEAKIKTLFGSAVFGTAGGGKLRAYQGTTPSSGGTAATVSKRNPNNPAAQLTAFNDATAITPASGTVVQRLSVGFAQTGGQGAWMALEPDDAITLLPNAGANGNLDIASICNGTTVALDIKVGHSEG